ncbi:MAG: type IX secretion system sortase PorU [Flavobacteriales bacterium]|nr:type IX secretion system sortase PorU [Flavobacteriales bacterium]
MKTILPAVFALALGTTTIAVGQETLSRTLLWADRMPSTGVKTAEVDGKVGYDYASKRAILKNAHLDLERDAMPIWQEVVALPAGTSGLTAVLQDATYEVVPQGQLDAMPSLRNAPPAPVVRASVSFERKLPYGSVSVEPFRTNPATGQVERLVDFRLDLTRNNAAAGQGRPKDYPATSKMASGEWFRFSVLNDGVYKMTYQNLQSMGVNVNDLSSDRINIYGSHFGQLPYQNSVERATDMLVNAIEVVDGGDGEFGPNDHILFYASGAHRWDRVSGKYKHTKNAYCDSATYFVGLDVQDPVRIAPAVLSDEPATSTVTRFTDRQFIERDLINLIKSGRTWFGETFDLTLSYTFSFSVPFLTGEPATLTVAGAARTLGTTNYSSFDVVSGSVLDQNISIFGVAENYTGPYGRYFTQDLTFSPTGSTVPLSITFNKFNPASSLGWLDYLELNCRRELRMIGAQLAFSDTVSVAPGSVSEFVVDQAAQVSRIWEITDPTDVHRVEFTTDGSSKRFKLSTDVLRRFIAFRDADYLVPTLIGRVPNQNLHATALPTDLVVVCPPELQSAATRLAERRVSEGLSVVMVTPQQVYNEFSSGSRDVTAIKRYMRLLYDNADTPEELPRYLLLFGDGSYNNISVVANNQNLIPSYQTEESLNPSRSYTSDDYFGLLDLNEGEGTADMMDIGVGRFPVSSLGQANETVDKVLGYDVLKMLSLTGSSCSENGDGGLVDWRSHVLFASDDQEGDNYEGIIHMSQSDQMATRVETEHPKFNVHKIYLDAYQQVSTPGGERYPQASADLREIVQKGLLLVNYVGHGGEVGWAHERFLDNTTILGWSNSDRLPLFMTATCEFSRWDDPGRTSAGEYVFLNPSGGGVGLMSTTRLAFSNQNENLANKFYDHVFDEEDEQGRPNRLGDIGRRTKRDMSFDWGTNYNHRNFCLLGDPSMRLAIPWDEIRITAITDTLGNAVDTLKALATVRIRGFVDDGNGQPNAGFQGQVVPIVFDKAQQQATLANDGGNPFLFMLRNSIIHRGRATVNSGEFDFTFVVPKDINYQVGNGRVSCYAESLTSNATGYANDVKVGSTATDVPLDEQGPEVELYLNDENFVHGGITDQDPLLLGKLFDANGINTVGSSIGHDLLAVVDENTDQAIVLNDLYEADLDTYKSGQVRYRLNDLAEGPHTLRLKAWDVHNNSSESTTEFVVTSSEEMVLDHVLNYPNPFTTRTEFFFEHNRPCTTLEVQVQVFTVSGRLVKTLNRQLACTGFRSEGLEWNGQDDFGDKLGRGVYVYRLNVSTPEGEKAEKFEKLVILR